MIEQMLILAGLFILGYGLYMAQKLRETLGSGDLKEAWDILMFLIGVFMAGYAGYLGVRYLIEVPFDPALVTGVVFFLGAIFVALTARANYRVFRVQE